ncbi:MAG: DUF6157 family protein [Bacteroidota bacterium]
MHSTNYYNTFIEIAEDCPTKIGEVPPLRGNKKSVANYLFDMVYNHPYEYTSDEVLFAVFATRKGFHKTDWEAERQKYFSKGQPCFRAAPLSKRYGWGVHSNAEGKVAIYAADDPQYQAFLKDDSIKKMKAMRSKRK